MSSIRANCRKIVCVGRNYIDHINELSSARPKSPLFFLKPPSSILSAIPPKATSTSTAPPSSATAQVIRPLGVTLHYEIELGIVIGRRLEKFPPSSPSLSSSSSSTLADLSSAISGYCLAIDMTARNVQKAAIKKGLPWSVAKGFDTFCPVSDLIPFEKAGGKEFLAEQLTGGDDDSPADPNPDKTPTMNFHLSVDGVEKQRGDPRSMIFKIPRLLTDITRVMTLEEGDLILTGTPSGVGPIVGGQRITCGVEVGGREVGEGAIEVVVADARDGYRFEEEQEES